MYVNVALNIPADKLFTYEVPQTLRHEVQIGKRVFVPFGRRKRTGFIVAINVPCNLPTIKSVMEILDDEALFGNADLDFYQWIATYFMYPLGKTLAELIPAGSEKKDFLWITPMDFPGGISVSPTQEKLLTLLQQYPQGISLHNLAEESGLKNISAIVQNLHLSGLLQIDEKNNRQTGAVGRISAKTRSHSYRQLDQKG
jgi:primosomal protein N' (replication factor Y)